MLALYIGDEFFEQPYGDEAWRGIKPELHVAYEDDNILIADKRGGMLRPFGRNRRRKHADQSHQGLPLRKGRVGPGSGAVVYTGACQPY